MKIRLNKSSRIQRIETDKAYAVAYNRKFPHFISKKHCMMIEVEKQDINDRQEWDVLIPDWMIHKNEDLKQSMRFLYDQNKLINNNTTDILWKKEKISSTE